MTSTTPLFTVIPPAEHPPVPDDIQAAYRLDWFGTALHAICLVCSFGWVIRASEQLGMPGQQTWATLRDHAQEHSGATS